MESDEEMKNNKECMKQLLQLLKTSCQERDEARDQLNKLLNNLMPCTPNTLPEFLPPPPQLLPESPLIQPAKGNSSITESNSLSADTFNYQSPVNSFFDPVSSPDSSSNFVFTNQPVFDQGCLVSDEIVKGRTLPQKENRFWKGAFAVVGIMSTLVIYGVLQEKIMTVPYGEKKEYFKYSLFLVFCNRLTTSAVSAGALLASKKALDPVAPLYKYCLVSVSNIVTTTCQYEALKYVSFPVQTLAKCAK